MDAVLVYALSVYAGRTVKKALRSMNNSKGVVTWIIVYAELRRSGGTVTAKTGKCCIN
jgi:hypothetical protein